jgi:hypothetical protein
MPVEALLISPSVGSLSSGVSQRMEAAARKFDKRRQQKASR